MKDLTYRQYVLYKCENKCYYIGTVYDITPSKMILNLMKKYVVCNKKVYLAWLPKQQVVITDDLPVSECLQSLPHLMNDRQDTTLIYTKAFNKISLTHIHWYCWLQMVTTNGWVDVELKVCILTNLVNECEKILVAYRQIKNKTPR